MLKSVEDKNLEIGTTEERIALNQSSRVATVARATVQLVLMLTILAGAYTVMQRMIAAQPERGSRPPINRAVPVEAVTVQLSQQRPTLRLFGEIVAGRTIDIRPPASGEIIEVNPNLAVGNRIEAGEMLFSIDPFDLEVALAEAEATLAQTTAAVVQSRARLASERSQLEIAREQLVFAQADLERAAALRQNGTLTAQQVEDRELLVSQRRQSVLQRENNIDIEEAGLQQQLANERRLQLGVERARRDLADATVAAPFSGVVRTADIEVGRLVSANDITVSMYDDGALDVRFTLTDAQYGRVATDSDPLIGREVDVAWRVGGESYAYVAEVSRIGADVAADRGGIDIYARITDPSANEVQIRPGAFVALQLPDRLYQQSARVPEQVVFDGPSVYLIEEGVLRRQSVTLHAYDGEEAIVSGVESGDLLLATRLSNAENGLAVRSADDPEAGTIEGRPLQRPQGGGSADLGGSERENQGRNGG